MRLIAVRFKHLEPIRELSKGIVFWYHHTGDKAACSVSDSKAHTSWEGTRQGTVKGFPQMTHQFWTSPHRHQLLRKLFLSCYQILLELDKGCRSYWGRRIVRGGEGEERETKCTVRKTFFNMKLQSTKKTELCSQLCFASWGQFKLQNRSNRAQSWVNWNHIHFISKEEVRLHFSPHITFSKLTQHLSLTDRGSAAGALSLRLMERLYQVWSLFWNKSFDRPGLCITGKCSMQEGEGIAGVVLG